MHLSTSSSNIHPNRSSTERALLCTAVAIHGISPTCVCMADSVSEAVLRFGIQAECTCKRRLSRVLLQMYRRCSQKRCYGPHCRSDAGAWVAEVLLLPPSPTAPSSMLGFRDLREGAMRAGQ